MEYYATEILQADQEPTQPIYIRIRNNGRMSITFPNRTFNLPPQLVNEIRVSLNAEPRSYLFINKQGNPFTKQSFRTWAHKHLRSVLDCDFLLSFFRIYYVTEYCSRRNRTEEELNMIDYAMGGSPELARSRARALQDQPPLANGPVPEQNDLPIIEPIPEQNDQPIIEPGQ